MKNTENKRMRFRYTPEKNIGIGFVDLLLVAVGFLVTAMILKGTCQIGALLSGAEAAGILLSCVFAVLFFWGFEMYSAILLKPYPIMVTAILSGIYTFICTFLILFLFTRSLDWLLFLALGTVLSFLFLCIWHIALYYYYQKWTHRPRMLMVEKLTDDNSRVRRLKYDCMSHYDAWYEHVDVENKEHVQEFIEKILPDYDVICLMETIPFDIRNMFMEAGLRMNKEFYVVPMTYEMNFAKVKLAYLDDVMVFHLRPTSVSPVNMMIKRAMDLVISSAALLIAFIPMCIIALLIKLTSPGPVFYKQLRMTKDKKEFYIYKFRSMVQDAEKKTGPALATKDDPRITKVGKWLRKLRLDELPQLINILKGDMSVVGPRPERPFFIKKYEKEIPNYDKRFLMKAGLTALSHVYGRYSTDIVDRTHYDLLYVQNYNLMMDIRIMLLTSRTLFLKDAAEGVNTTDRRKTAGNPAK
ncbi:MAG: sugar transferase [Oscillospiraceae bacterium]|nr:sugar transferase [Oscillospiraceae bacterium]MBQ7130647.1 sugar transferase [Oscillospiraceae bacterium]